jgi:predicted unusual protein kinase regulating ubiquinone biosynthesis (AarF/ABC1/UbiB family)
VAGRSEALLPGTVNRLTTPAAAPDTSARSSHGAGPRGVAPPSTGPLAADEFLRPLGRRKMITTPEELSFAPVLAAGDKKRAPVWLILTRSLFWAGHLLRSLIRLIGRTLIGRNTIEWRARELRHLLQAGGTVSQKLGQQMSIRTDTLDPAYCHELGKLLDQAPPMSLRDALAEIERAYRRPPQEVFRHFDPVPIGSASIACVYQAELPSGERVAVKVRRRNLIPPLDADLRIILGLARIAEATSVLPESSATSFVGELRRMLLEETDFTIEARYTELFRRSSNKISYVSAPKLYADLSTSSVLVTEFCPGAFLSEFLIALDTGQQAELQRLLDRGFDLEKIARSLCHAFFWGVFEADVFHADVHPANIIVQPDNTLIFIDFGSCGRFSSQFRQKLRTMIVALNSGHADLAARATLSLSEPMPLIETSKVTDQLTTLCHRYYLAVKSKHSPWQEKTSGGLFIQSVKVLGQYGIVPSAELVRFCRANMLYDTLIYRLHPRLNPAKERRRYDRDMYKRRAREILKDFAKRADGPLARDVVAVREIVEVAERFADTARRWADVPRFSFLGGISKAAYTFGVLLRTAVTLLVLLALVGAGRLLSSEVRATLPAEPSWDAFWMLVRGAMASLTFQILAGLTWLISLRKIMLGLKTTDVKNQL